MTSRPVLTNWAGNVRYGADVIHRPTSLDELRDIIVRADRVRATGTGHSFNLVGDAASATRSSAMPGDLVSLAAMPAVIQIDQTGRSVTVGGGVSYARLADELHRAGFGLHNMASLPHISVAGAVATGTHGSGPRNGNLATAVTEIEFVTADGEQMTWSRDNASDDGTEAFSGSVVALGALGVVTRLTLRIEPTYEVAQSVYEGLAW